MADDAEGKVAIEVRLQEQRARERAQAERAQAERAQVERVRARAQAEPQHGEIRQKKQGKGLCHSIPKLQDDADYYRFINEFRAAAIGEDIP